MARSQTPIESSLFTTKQSIGTLEQVEPIAVGPPTTIRQLETRSLVEACFLCQTLWIWIWPDSWGRSEDPGQNHPKLNGQRTIMVNKMDYSFHRPLPITMPLAALAAATPA